MGRMAGLQAGGLDRRPVAVSPVLWCAVEIGAGAASSAWARERAVLAVHSRVAPLCPYACTPGAPGNDRKLTDLHHTGSARTRGLCGRFRRREYTPFVLKFAARGRDSAEISRF